MPNGEGHSILRVQAPAPADRERHPGFSPNRGPIRHEGPTLAPATAKEKGRSIGGTLGMAAHLVDFDQPTARRSFREDVELMSDPRACAFPERIEVAKRHTIQQIAPHEPINPSGQ